MRTPKQAAQQRKRGWQGWGKRIALTQIAAQVGLIVAPLYSAYAHAQDAAPQDPQAEQAQQAQSPTLQKKLAELVKQVGDASNTPQSNVDLKGMAAQQLGSGAAAAAQDALGRFGTARVDLSGIDDLRRFSGAVDTLLPLYDTESHLLFTQLGLRRNDGQVTGNLGFGHRYFGADWMLGYNAFYDQNISRGHQRFGAGVEAWRDYLKLSGNAYLRLSNWKESPDLQDYDERPANGFDVRAEGYLPAMPSLGAKLMYEQYFGNEVGLLGAGNRQSNPSAFTVGLNYTPIPLVTLGVDHRMSNGRNSTSANVQFTYKLGEPWAKQIDPRQVAARRSLAGSRMDLVERNNNIVLEYRKRQLIKLNLPAQITGKSTNTVELPYTVEAKNGLSRIQWHDGALVAAGGAVVALGDNKFQIRLPAYQTGTANTYPLTGIAYDAQGNASAVAATTVVVGVGDVDAGKTTVSAAPLLIPATGKGVSTLTINLLDAGGNAIDGMVPHLSATLAETLDTTATISAAMASVPAQPATLGQFTEVSPGVYQVAVTSGTRPGTIVVTPKVGDTALTDVTIIEAADAASARIDAGNFLVVTTGMVANGTATNEVRALVTDEAGNPVPGVTVAFGLSGSAQVAAGSSPTPTTDARGYVTLKLTDIKAETVTITATLVNGAQASVDTAFIADAATASLASSDLTVDKNVVTANGTDHARFTAIVKDANGNVVPGITVTWDTNAGNLSGTTSVTDSNGVATINLTHTLAASAQVNARVGSATAVNAPAVTFVADSASATIDSGDLTVDKASIVANDTEIATYTAIVKDTHGNVVPNLAVAWDTNLGTLSATSSMTDASGVATITLHGTVAGSAQVTAQVNATGAVNAPLVTLVADSASATIGSGGVTVDKTSIVADDAEVATFSAVVKDANGNPVANVDVTWDTTFATLGATTSKTNDAGVASVTLRGAALGTAQVSARLGSATAVNAPPVTLTANSATARIATLTSSIAKITSTGDESSTLTATVTDASGHVLQGATVDWSTTRGDLAGATSVTDANGQATMTFTAIETSTSDQTATITAGTNSTTRTAPITLRTVVSVGGKYYWTQRSDFPVATAAAADAACRAHGGGASIRVADVSAFAAAGGDFKLMSVAGEYDAVYFEAADTWGTEGYSFNSNRAPVGSKYGWGVSGQYYVCVK